MAAKPLQHTAANPKALLYNVIIKAKLGGFRFKNFIDNYDSFTISSFNHDTGRMALVLRNEQVLRVVYDSIYVLFFDLCFARAFFGDDWERHLVELAEADDKLQYLAQYIFNSEQHV